MDTSYVTSPRRGHVDLVGAIETGGVLEALMSAIDTRRSGLAGSQLQRLLGIVGHGDVLARVAASLALGRHPGVSVDRALLGLLASEHPSLREAAALAFADRMRFAPAVAPLRRVVVEGGFGGMLAQLALDEWARPRYARFRVEQPRSGAAGLRIAQVSLQGRIDGGLQEAGAGDGGGLATMLVHLSRALGRRPDVDEVFTITRAFVDQHARASHEILHEPIDEHASIERIAFGPDRYLATAEMWPYRREVERALDRSLRALMPLDVVHLRFADVGTFAAARVCRRLGIPVCFTLAADPHVVIRAAERAGTLTRERWADVDQREHYLFRTLVIETMLEQARGLVVFPRPRADGDLRDLLHLDETATAAGRIRSVAEGISLDTIDRAAPMSTGGPESVTRHDLCVAVRALPPPRAGLPLVISVARFHRVKGLHRLLEAWAGDPELFASFNLAIVGGNLELPTVEERTVIELLGDVRRRYPRATDGLLLLGHRAHHQVAELLHAAWIGVGDSVGPRGVFACASDKEEFGLALLEALAVGLPVVAPQIGGPATYIDDRSTGFLVDTGSVDDLRRGLKGAAALRHDDGRAASASTLVRERFSVDAMAEQLTSLYSELRGPREVVAVA